MEVVINNEQFPTQPLGSETASVRDVFEAALARGVRPRIEDFLRSVPPPKRPELFKLLLQSETEHLRRTKQAPSRDDYTARFQEFTAIIDTVFADETGRGDRTEAFDPLATQERFATRPNMTDEAFPATAPVPDTPVHCGRFRVVRPHARGGLGEVFLAQDGELRRNVALKRIRGRFVDDAESRARFVREAEITGNLEHPGIVPIYGLGIDDDGCPYYAMRFIEGETLQETIKQFHKSQESIVDGARQRELRKLLQRFIDVCNAMEYAHSRDVIHRDLKPANIMVGKFGETLVVDWGLAKAVGQSEEQYESNSPATQLGQAIGTPQFMSPEQAEGRHDDLTAATDIYALGAVLYAMLSGKPPIEGKSLGEVLMNVVRGSVAPLPPSTPGPLCSICRRALAVNPNDRYPTARALADDVEKWLADDRVDAHRESFVERTARWARTHRAAVAGGVALTVTGIVALALGLFAVSSEQRATDRERAAADRARSAADSERRRAETERAEAVAARLKESAQRKRADEQRDLAEAQTERAEWTAYLAHITAADAEWDRNQPLRAVQHLEACLPKFHGWEHEYLAWKFRRGRTEIKSLPSIRAVAFHPDGSQFVTAGWDKRLRITDSATNTVRLLPDAFEYVNDLVYSPDGKTILAGYSDKSMRLFDVAGGHVVRAYEKEPDGVMSVAFDAEGKRCVAGCLGGALRIRDVKTGELISAQLQMPIDVSKVGFSRDGLRLLVAAGAEIALVDIADGGGKKFSGHAGRVTDAMFSPDEKVIVSSGSDRAIKLWDVDAGKMIVELHGHASEITDIDFSPDGLFIVSAGRDTTLKLWDLRTGQAIRSLIGHSRPIACVAASPKGDKIVSGGNDQPTVVWDLSVGEEPRSYGGAPQTIFAVAISPDGNIVAQSGNPGMVHLRSSTTGRGIRPLLSEPAVPVIWDIAFDAGGTQLAAACSDGTVRVWNVATGEQTRTLRGHNGVVNDVAFSPDGRRIASGGVDNTARLWNIEAGTEISKIENGQGRVNGVAWSPDGTTVGIGSSAGPVNLRRADTGALVTTLTGPKSAGVQYLDFSPDGTLVACACSDDTIRLWRIAEPNSPKILLGHTGSVNGLVFSRDGKRLVSGSEDRTVKLWDVATGAETFTFRGHQSVIKRVGISADGHKIVSGETERLLKVWSSADDRTRLEPNSKAP